MKHSTGQHFDQKTQKRLGRLVRISANLTQAHSCFLLLPDPESTGSHLSDPALRLIASHSLSNELLDAGQIALKADLLKKGLLGWIVQNGRHICASPFDGSSFEAIFYKQEQGLKSFLGLPIRLSSAAPAELSQIQNGVLICDSRAPYAFSDLQVKLLGDLTEEIAEAYFSADSFRKSSAQVLNLSESDEYSAFFTRALELISKSGPQAVEVLRLNCLNFSDLERSQGTDRCVRFFHQFARLVKQAMPQHFACCALPNADVLIVLDKMMGKFYENRLMALCDHLKEEAKDGLLYMPVRKPISKRRDLRTQLQMSIISAGMLPHERTYSPKINTAPKIKTSVENSIYEYRSA